MSQPSKHEAWVPLFKVQVFFSCVSFSIIVPSIANYLDRMGAEEYVLGVAVAMLITFFKRMKRA